MAVCIEKGNGKVSYKLSLQTKSGSKSQPKRLGYPATSAAVLVENMIIQCFKNGNCLLILDLKFYILGC